MRHSMLAACLDPGRILDGIDIVWLLSTFVEHMRSDVIQIWTIAGLANQLDDVWCAYSCFAGHKCTSGGSGK